MSICKTIYQEILKSLPEILSLRNTKMLKEDGSYVSKGDLLCEKIAMDYINQLDEEYFVISEETPIEDLSLINEKENILIIDPIDGTENFVSGLKEWGIGISIYKNHTHHESILALPELGLSICTGDTFERFESRIYGLSSSLSKEQIAALEAGYEYRIIGCCMYNMYNVLTGSFAVYKNPKGANCWDILPGLNLALEHNIPAFVENKSYHGELLLPNQKYRFRVGNQ